MNNYQLTINNEQLAELKISKLANLFSVYSLL